MIYKYFVIIVFGCLSHNLFAQINDGFIYGTPDKIETGFSFCHTPDNGFLILGEQSDTTYHVPKIFLLKIDSTGQIQWSKIIGEIFLEFSGDIIMTSDSNYMILGAGLFDTTRGVDLCLIKINNTGTILWTKAIGTPDSEAAGIKIIQTSDRGFIIGGSTYIATGGLNMHGEPYIVKTDSLGNVQWGKSYDGGINDYFKDIVLSDDGGYFVVGSAIIPSGEPRAFYMKIDSLGNVQWAKKSSAPCRSYSCTCLNNGNGNYIVSGGTFCNGIFFIVVDSSGNIIHSTGIESAYDASEMIRKNDGSIMIPLLHLTKIGFLHTDSLLNFLSFHETNNFAGRNYFFSQTIQLSDSTFAFVSSSDLETSDVLFRYFSDSLSQCDLAIPIIPFIPDTATTPWIVNIQSATNNEELTLHDSIIQLDRNTICGENITTGFNSLSTDENHIEIFPVPFYDFVTAVVPDKCTLIIYDLFYTKLKEFQIGHGNTNLDLGFLTQGLYIAEFDFGNQRRFKKILKLKN